VDQAPAVTPGTSEIKGKYKRNSDEVCRGLVSVPEVADSAIKDLTLELTPWPTNGVHYWHEFSGKFGAVPWTLWLDIGACAAELGVFDLPKFDSPPNPEQACFVSGPDGVPDLSRPGRISRSGTRCILPGEVDNTQPGPALITDPQFFGPNDNNPKKENSIPPAPDRPTMHEQQKQPQQQPQPAQTKQPAQQPAQTKQSDPTSSQHPSGTSTAQSAPNPPSNLTVTATDPYHILISWQDNSSNETGFQVHNGNEIRGAGGNATSYVWPSTPGSYMCVRVRTIGATGVSSWEPVDSPYYRCTTTPRATTESAHPSPLPEGSPCKGPLGQPGIVRNGECYLGTAM
jgi:hypothetical protein